MLQLEFLSDGSPDCPLLRLAGNDPIACSVLHDGLARLTSGQIDRLEIDQLPGVNAADGCRLCATIGRWDRGVIRQGCGNTFEWVLTRGTWDNVVGLIEPFCLPESPAGYQWLESAGALRVLITTTGAW